jgi:Sec-independent protein translocase protein TatA
MGKGLREFKDSVSGRDDEDDDSKPEIEPAVAESEDAALGGEPKEAPLEGEVVHQRKS